MARKQKYYKDTLVKGERFVKVDSMEDQFDLMNGKEKINGNQVYIDMEEKEDYSGFSIVEEVNCGRPCSNFFISKKDEDILFKP